MRAQQRADRADPFPWVVTAGCLLAGLGLFVHSAVPALSEREALRREHGRLVDELRSADQGIAAERGRRQRLETDPETLFVEMDAHGVHPEQAEALHPGSGAGLADGAEVPR